uniref:(northern house mosquito) hypothetical protein n=1 Tax=Culex pipiens TaxID=7175 RepID=A0A8D7ZZ11_CULPI
MKTMKLGMICRRRSRAGIIVLLRVRTIVLPSGTNRSSRSRSRAKNPSAIRRIRESSVAAMSGSATHRRALLRSFRNLLGRRSRRLSVVTRLVAVIPSRTARKVAT